MKNRNKKGKIEQFLKTNKFQRSEIVIIGDSPEEVEIGRDLDLKTISITNGYYATSRLTKSNPDFLISNLKEVISIIKKN